MEIGSESELIVPKTSTKGRGQATSLSERAIEAFADRSKNEVSAQLRQYHDGQVTKE